MLLVLLPDRLFKSCKDGFGNKQMGHFPIDGECDFMYIGVYIQKYIYIKIFKTLLDYHVSGDFQCTRYQSYFILGGPNETLCVAYL